MPSLDSKNRVDHAKAFILTSYPWKESSLWIEVFSEQYGRVPLLARSARKPHSSLRGTLMPFAPLLLSWYGQNELRTLHRAEWVGGMIQPSGASLLAGFYLNELMLKLTARDDAHPALFNAFSQILEKLSQGEKMSANLRKFEWQLLYLQGLMSDLRQDDQGNEIDEKANYLMLPESLPKLWCEEREPLEGIVVSGAGLKSLRSEANIPEHLLPELLKLNRMLIGFRLPEGISSRTLLEQMKTF